MTVGLSYHSNRRGRGKVVAEGAVMFRLEVSLSGERNSKQQLLQDEKL